MNKRKVLDTARKFAQKGAKEKAIKEYAKLLKADSRDAKLLLEIGDTHRRWGQNEEAISYYARVAEQYKQGGFDARAVAVFKQILNLDGKRYPAYVSLAELYQRMGLDAEAVHSLQTAADGYHREGQKHEALELLRKMATLDPSNTTSRLKVAELLRQEDLLDDAVAEYEAVVDELVRQGADDALIPVYERILEIQPERADVELALARNLVQQSQTERAEGFASRAFDHQPDAPGLFDLLCGIYTELGKTDELMNVTKTMARMHRDRGDDDEARTLMQRLPGGDALELPDVDPEAVEAQNVAAEDEGLLDGDFLDDDFLGDLSGDLPAATQGIESAHDSFAGDGSTGDLEIELGDEYETESETGSDTEAEPGSSDASIPNLPEGDPDQLFAEASVYLRYGKRDQAIASLEAILEQEPRHRDAIEKIGEFHADEGDAPKAVRYWLQAATLARSVGDEAAVEVLRERIEVLDPDAAAGLAPEPPLFELPETDSSLSGSALSDSTLSDSALEASDIEIDPEVELGADALSAEASIELDPLTHDDSTDELDLGEAWEADSTIVDPSESVSDAAAVSASMGGAGGSAATSATGPLGASSTHGQQIAEDLEEAEFYMEQELFDEAEAIYNRLLEVAPNHPSAMLRLGELRAARGEDPSASGSAEALDGDTTLDPGADGELEIAVEIAVDLEADADRQADVAEDAGPCLDEADAEIEIEFDADTLGSGEPAADSPLADSSSTDPSGLAADGEEIEIEIELGDDGVGEEPVLDPATTQDALALDAQPEGLADADEDDSFDLAAELRETFDADADEDEEQTERSDPGEATCEQEGFASIFRDFKSGVEKTLAEDDYETRFDLGIAYRGMELLDDALGEFRICLESDGHRLESLHMMGLCAIDLGRFSDASNHLEQALASEEFPAQKEAGLRFDLARSFEGREDYRRALDSFEAAKAADPTLPGIDESIARVSQRVASDDELIELDKGEPRGAGDAEQFEDFDDLLAEVEAEDRSDETFATFDDVAEAASANPPAPAESAASGAADAEAESDPGSSADGDPGASGSGTATKKRSRKRISFV